MINTEDSTHFNYTPLIWASEKGHHEIVQLLLEIEGIDINKASGSADTDGYTADGYTALIGASWYEQAEVVKLLMQKEGIDINKADERGNSALFFVSRNGNTEILQLLLEQDGIEINKEDNFGETALNKAVLWGNAEVVQLLLNEEGIYTKATNQYGIFALYQASKDGYADIVQLLVKHKDTDVNRATGDGETALYIASHNGHTEVVRILLESPDIELNREYNNETVLWIASVNGHTITVQIILEHPRTNIAREVSPDEDINAKVAKLIFNQPTSVKKETQELFVAAILGNATKVSACLESNETTINVNSYDSFHRTPLFWASTRGNIDVIEVLLGQADVLVNVGRSGNGANALYQASKYGIFDTVTILLQHPLIDVNYQTFDKKTSLMVASMYGHSKVVRKLLSIVNINVNHATFNGFTALIYAVFKKQQNILDILLRCPKTDTSLQDDEYLTALERAKERNDTELIPLFRARGTIQKFKGHTCCSKTIDRGLHVAIEHDDLSWIKTFLICPGIDINVHNKDGQTPLNLVTLKGLKGIVYILLADQRIDVNKINTGLEQNAILIASERGHIEITRLLLLHNQTFVNQKNAQGQSALSTALKKYQDYTERHIKYFQIVKLLLRCPKTELPFETFYRSDIRQVIELRSWSMDFKPTCCLHVNESLLGAALLGDFRAIRGLLECPGTKSNVNTVDNKGRTPLYIAAMMGHLEAVMVLLRNRDLDVNIGRSITGGTAFSIASENSRFDVLRALIDSGKATTTKGWCNDNWTYPCKTFADFILVTPARLVPSGKLKWYTYISSSSLGQEA